MGGYRHLISILVRQAKRAELGLENSDFVIISVGELNDNKNHQVIIRAIEDISSVKYVIVGKGVLEEDLKRLANNLGISNQVILTGFRTDVRDLLWMSDCFAFPSKREGLGIAALEAMSAGLPVIGHDIGGIRDFVIDEETGWLCDGDEYETVVRKAIKETIIMNNGCSQKATEFDVKRTDAIMRELYNRYE